MTTAWLLPLLLPTVLATAQGEAVEEQELIFRIYETESLLVLSGPSSDHQSMLPFAGLSASEEGVEEPEDQWILEMDQLAEIVRNCVEPDSWDYEEARMQTLGDRRLAVLAPSGIHDQIQALLGWLEQGLLPTQRLSIQVFAGTAEGIDELSYATAEAGQRIETRLAEGSWSLLRRGSVELLDGAVRRIDSVAVTPTILRWEVEIAQAAVAGDPVSAVVTSGLTALVKAAPTAGGTYVDLIVRESEHRATRGRRPTGVAGTVVTNDSRLSTRSLGLMDDPEVAFASFAGSLVVPQGQTLFLPVEVQTVGGPVSMVFTVAVEGAPRAVRSGLDLPARQRRLEIVHVGAATSGAVAVSALPNFAFEPDSYGWMEFWSNSLNVAGIGWGDEGSRRIHLDECAELVRQITPVLDEEPETWLEVWPERVVTYLPPDESSRIGEFLTTLARPGTAYEVHGKIRSRTGGERGSFRLPVMDGRPAALWSGSQGSQVVGWDADVANNSWIHSPEMTPRIDGFALRLVVHPTGSGMPLVEVNGRLCFLEESPIQRNLETGDGLFVEQARLRTLSIDDARSLPQDGILVFDGGDLSLELAFTRL